MRQHIGKLVGWDSNGEGLPERFYFLNAVFDYGPCGENGPILKGATGAELVGVTSEHLACLLTDEGLIWRFSDYEEACFHTERMDIPFAWEDVDHKADCPGQPVGRCCVETPARNHVRHASPKPEVNE